jgi:hypothetical protein
VNSSGRGGDTAEGPGRPEDQNRWDDPLTRDDGSPATPADSAQPTVAPEGVDSSPTADASTLTDNGDDWTTSTTTSSSSSSVATSDTDEDSGAFDGSRETLSGLWTVVIRVVLGLVMADHLL